MKWVTHGYDVGEVVKEIVTADDFKIKLNEDIFLSNPSKVEAVLLPGGTTLACIPRPNSHQLNLAIGIAARLGRERVTPNKSTFAEFSRFVKRVIQLVPEFSRPIQLPAGYEDFFDYFIQKSQYPEYRKQELRDKWNSISDYEYTLKRYTVNKTFGKREGYKEPKLNRGIYSRHDIFKCFCGGFFKLIEEDVFSRPEFIKKIPVAERPSYLMEKMYEPGAKYFSSDFESFESLFTPELMKACEIELYKTKMVNFPQHMKFISNVLLGESHIQAKGSTATVKARRMSGEMCTSLGNGFTNLMVSWFIQSKAGIPLEDLISGMYCIIEGDDSLIKYKNEIDVSIYQQIGLRAKVEFHEKIGDASFCGMLFDEDDKIVVTDLSKHIISMFWADSKYVDAREPKKLALLRAKALSYAFQFRGCPVIDPMAHKILELTKSIDHRSVVIDNWKKQQFDLACANAKELIAKGPLEAPIKTRLLIERTFGISLETQLRMESLIPTMTLKFNDFIAEIASPEALTHAFRHVRPILDGRDELYQKFNISKEQIEGFKKCLSPAQAKTLTDAVT